MAETVLVSGASGYVAGWCIRLLLERGYVVRSTLRDLGKGVRLKQVLAPVGAEGRLSFFKADLMDDAGWAEAMAGVDFVLHVASPLGDGKAVARDALVGPARDGTLRVLRAAVAAGVRRVVMTSAAATTRPPLSENRPSVETNWADPDDPQFDAYRVSKILAEKAAWDFMRAEGGTTEFTTVLPGAVFGPVLSPDQAGSVEIIGAMLAGKPRVRPKLGFWVVDVRDLADLHIKAMLSPRAAGERYLATAEFMWFRDISRVLRSRLGARAAKVPTIEMPNWLMRLLMPLQPQIRTLGPLLGRRFEVDASKARRELGFAPRPAADTIVDCAESLLKSPKTTSP